VTKTVKQQPIIYVKRILLLNGLKPYVKTLPTDIYLTVSENKIIGLHIMSYLQFIKSL
jgi:hypothetical protein